jgi:hypothetical protein
MASSIEGQGGMRFFEATRLETPFPQLGSVACVLESCDKKGHAFLADPSNRPVFAAQAMIEGAGCGPGVTPAVSSKAAARIRGPDRLAGWAAKAFARSERRSGAI